MPPKKTKTEKKKVQESKVAALAKKVCDLEKKLDHSIDVTNAKFLEEERRNAVGKMTIS